MKYCNCSTCVRRRIFPKPAVTRKCALEGKHYYELSRDDLAFIEGRGLAKEFPDQFSSLIRGLFSGFDDSDE